MNVLFLNGSPHEYGCTRTALDEIATVLSAEDIETELLWVGTTPVAGCRACWACGKIGRCVIDDAVNAAAEKLLAADAFIVGSPVYFANASGQVRSFLDRLFLVCGNRLAGKLGAAVVSCRRGGASAAFDEINKYFLIRSMHVVGSQYWNQVHGSCPDDVRKDLEGLQTMRTLGHNMAWLLKSIAAGRAAGLPLPVIEPPLRTDFIR